MRTGTESMKLETPHVDALRAEVKDKRVSELDNRQWLLNSILWMIDNEGHGITQAGDRLIRMVDELFKLASENRRAGREEALQILLGTSPEDWDGTKYAGSHAIADTGDYGTHWLEPELRELFDLVEPGAAHSLIDRLEGMYWDQLNKIEELERMLSLHSAALDPVLRFAGRCLDNFRGDEIGDLHVDGGTAQEWAEQDGLIEARQVTQPCGDNCSCAEVTDFPAKCYFLTEVGRRAVDLVRLDPREKTAAPTPVQEQRITITLRQARNLVAFFGGSDTDVTVTYRRAGWAHENEDGTGEPIPAGLWAHCTEYPEEGCGFLGKTEVLPEPIEPTQNLEARALYGLFDLATSLHHALDDSEEIEGGKHVIAADWMQQLSWVTGRLDLLPDDQPGYIMDYPAKARWALRGLVDRLDGAQS